MSTIVESSTIPFLDKIPTRALKLTENIETFQGKVKRMGGHDVFWRKLMNRYLSFHFILTESFHFYILI